MAPAALSPSSEARRLSIAACLAAALVYLASASGRYLVNDDYQLLYTAWRKSLGEVPGRDFYVTSYHAMVEPLSLALAWFPDSLTSLFLARGVLLLILLGVALCTFGITRRLFDSTAAWLALPSLLVSSSMLHRSLDLRPDLLTTLLWLAAAWLALVDLRRPASRLRPLLIGLLLGAAVANRFKAVLVVLLIGMGLLLAARARVSGRRARLAAALGQGLWVAAGAAAAFGLYLLVLSLTDDVGGFVGTQSSVASGLDTYAALEPHLKWRTVTASIRVDPLFWGLVLVGAARSISEEGPASRRTFLVALLGLAAISVTLNPAYYSYNLVTLLPLLAPFAGYGAARVLRRLTQEGGSLRRWGVAVACAFGPFVLAAPAIYHLALRRSIDHQVGLHRFVSEHLPADARVFGMEGVGLFRGSVYHWRMPWILTSSYRQGAFRYAAELEAAPAELIVESYRVPGWLVEEDAEYLRQHYVRLAPSLLVPGLEASQGAPAEGVLVVAGRYELLADAGATCRVDGRQVSPGDVTHLARGGHRLEVDAGSAVLRRYHPPEARSLVSNPRGLPYLVPPDLVVPGEAR